MVNCYQEQRERDFLFFLVCISIVGSRRRLLAKLDFDIVKFALLCQKHWKQVIIRYS